MSGKLCWSTNEFPKETHYVIIETGTSYVEGDERSKQYPGHGYPGHSEPFIRYYAFDNLIEWDNEVKKRVVQGKENFIAMKVIPAKITTSVNVAVEF